MKAKVKRIKVGTQVRDGAWYDKFVSGMYTKDVLEFIPLEIMGKKYPNWYRAAPREGRIYAYHISWLKGIQE